MHIKKSYSLVVFFVTGAVLMFYKEDCRTRVEIKRAVAAVTEIPKIQAAQTVINTGAEMRNRGGADSVIKLYNRITDYNAILMDSIMCLNLKIDLHAQSDRREDEIRERAGELIITHREIPYDTIHSMALTDSIKILQALIIEQDHIYSLRDSMGLELRQAYAGVLKIKDSLGLRVVKLEKKVKRARWGWRAAGVAAAALALKLAVK